MNDPVVKVLSSALILRQVLPTTGPHLQQIANAIVAKHDSPKKENFPDGCASVEDGDNITTPKKPLRISQRRVLMLSRAYHDMSSAVINLSTSLKETAVFCLVSGSPTSPAEMIVFRGNLTTKEAFAAHQNLLECDWANTPSHSSSGHKTYLMVILPKGITLGEGEHDLSIEKNWVLHGRVIPKKRTKVCCLTPDSIPPEVIWPPAIVTGSTERAQQEDEYLFEWFKCIHSLQSTKLE
eukprot:PhF_6_TR43387/c0_g1_i1/m.66589